MKKMDFKTDKPIIWIDTTCIIDWKKATAKKPLPPRAKLIAALDYLAMRENINVCFIDTPNDKVTCDELSRWHENYTPERVKTGHIVPAPDGITKYLRVCQRDVRHTDILLSNNLTELSRWDRSGGTSLYQSDVLLKMVPFAHMPADASSEQFIQILKKTLKEVEN